MSWANNGPAGAPQGQPYTPPQPPPPQGPQQPRWAWWVGGILIPLLGILVSVLVSQSNSSGDDGDRNVESAPTSAARSGGDEGQGGGETQSSAPPAAAETWEKVYGPVKLEVEKTDISGTKIDLDTPKQPLANAGDGADFSFGAEFLDPSLSVPDDAKYLAPWPDPGTAPTPEGCMDSVDTNGSYSATVKRGEQYCLLTGEGRIAHIKVRTAPDSGGGILDVTVWESPDA